MECNIENNRTNTNIVRRIAVTYNPSHDRDTPAQLIRATVSDNLCLPRNEPDLKDMAMSFFGEWPAELAGGEPEIELGEPCEDHMLRHVRLSMTFTIIDYTGGNPQDVAQRWLEDCYDAGDDYIEYLCIVATETVLLDDEEVE